ncbi:MAG TPA: VWA domain-containing protein [Chitinophagaceae bacterium]|nr:VWA domain-containing protein [Chitinophagaceae bacterium]
MAHIQWKKRVRRRLGDPQMVNKLVGPDSSKLFFLKFILLVLALGAGILAAMNPRKPGKNGDSSRKGIDLVIALDVSKSMLAVDIQPNRLEKAREFIYKLMDQMPDDRLALVLFAGKSYLQMPLTIDHGAAKMYVESANPGAVPQQGTVISEALKMSAGVFINKESKFKSVLLISDGEDHDEEAVSTARDLAGQGVMINAIGIGSPEGSVIIDPQTGETKKDASGNDVMSKLNEDELKQIAAATNGLYLRLEDTDKDVKTLQQYLSRIDPQSIIDLSTVNYKNGFIWLAAIMLILLGIEILVPEIYSLKRLPSQRLA